MVERSWDGKKNHCQIGEHVVCLCVIFSVKESWMFSTTQWFQWNKTTLVPDNAIRSLYPQYVSGKPCSCTLFVHGDGEVLCAQS